MGFMAMWVVWELPHTNVSTQDGIDRLDAMVEAGLTNEGAMQD
jgi:hypothetical protein